MIDLLNKYKHRMTRNIISLFFRRKSNHVKRLKTLHFAHNAQHFFIDLSCLFQVHCTWAKNSMKFGLISCQLAHNHFIPHFNFDLCCNFSFRSNALNCRILTEIQFCCFVWLAFRSHILPFHLHRCRSLFGTIEYMAAFASAHDMNF